MNDVNGKILIDIADPIWRSGVLDAVQTFFEKKNIKFCTMLNVTDKDYIIGDGMTIATKKQDNSK